MQNKKGAIELSMTTIIVIVLGVTLLVLGLAFIKNIFKNLGGISDKTFEDAQDLLGGIDRVDKLLTVTPTDIKVNQGADKPVKVIIANLNKDAITIKAVVSSGGDDKLSCLFYDLDTKKGKEESDSYPINSGKQVKLALIAKDLNGALRRTGCIVEIHATSGSIEGEQKKETLLINVVKE